MCYVQKCYFCRKLSKICCNTANFAHDKFLRKLTRNLCVIFIQQILYLICKKYIAIMTKRLYNVKSVKGQKKTFIKELESEIHELRVENEKLKSEVAYWKQKAANNDEVTEKGDLSVIVQKFASVEVKNQQILPENMVINSFGPNLDVLIHNYPIIAFLFNFLFTGTQRRKERANATAKEWKNWLQLYKCFIADMLLRTKKAKSVLITPMLISMVLLYTRASDSLWALLSKLRIACLQPKLKDWIINQPEKKISEENVLLFSFDNCDFFRHVTNVRSSNKSTMINTCTQLVQICV